MHSRNRTPRQNGKFEARNPKLETMSNDKDSNVPNKFVSELVLDFDISSSFPSFEIVSDFDIRISNLVFAGLGLATLILKREGQDEE
jgi:hypothetical protein